MPKNRYHPYGYHIRDGRIQINDAESKIIRRIFRSYAQGASYKTIAEALSASSIAYMPEKPLWNKNMVARIFAKPELSRHREISCNTGAERIRASTAGEAYIHGNGGL